eukprot:1473615-Rhodomonas_salina.1
MFDVDAAVHALTMDSHAFKPTVAIFDDTWDNLDESEIEAPLLPDDASGMNSPMEWVAFSKHVEDHQKFGPALAKPSLAPPAVGYAAILSAGCPPPKPTEGAHQPAYIIASSTGQPKAR